MRTFRQNLALASSIILIATAVFLIKPLTRVKHSITSFAQRKPRAPRSDETLLPPAAGRKPHIVVLLADDFGWANIGYHRTKEDDPANEVVTPALNSLAASGIELDRHYAFRYCSPTRSSLLTGRLPVHVNVENLRPDYSNPDDPISGSPGIPRSMSTIASKLRAAGYATHQVGKWDAGMATWDHTPLGRGFESSLNYFHHNIYYYTHIADGYVDLWNTDRPARRLAGSKYAEELFHDRCTKIIDEHDPATPLFLYYGIHIAHGPLEVPEEYSNRFAFVNNTARRLYAAMIAYMDDVIADLVQQLKDKGMWDDTIILFSSDNGGPEYEGGGGNNYPLRGGKTSNFEGGVRVNAFVSGGFLPPHRRGIKEDGYIHISDWFTTFCSLAGVDPTDKLAEEANLPPVDGIDMWPYLSGQVAESPRTEVQLDTTALISGDYKLLTGDNWEDYWVGPQYPNETNPEGGYLNTLQCGDGGCLFNIRSDPTEHVDLAQELTEKRLEMLQRLAVLNTSFFNPDRGPKDPKAKAQARENGGYWGPWLP